MFVKTERYSNQSEHTMHSASSHQYVSLRPHEALHTH